MAEGAASLGANSVPGVRQPSKKPPRTPGDAKTAVAMSDQRGRLSRLVVLDATLKLCQWLLGVLGRSWRFQ